MNIALALGGIQALVILIALVNLGLTAWLHLRFARMPGGTVNVRAVLGALDAVRVQMDSMHTEDGDHFTAVRAKLSNLIDMIDIYVLRVHGSEPKPEKRP